MKSIQYVTIIPKESQVGITTSVKKRLRGEKYKQKNKPLSKIQVAAKIFNIIIRLHHLDQFLKLHLLKNCEQQVLEFLIFTKKIITEWIS